MKITPIDPFIFKDDVEVGLLVLNSGNGTQKGHPLKKEVAFRIGIAFILVRVIISLDLDPNPSTK